MARQRRVGSKRKQPATPPVHCSNRTRLCPGAHRRRLRLPSRAERSSWRFVFPTQRSRIGLRKRAATGEEETQSRRWRYRKRHDGASVQEFQCDNLTSPLMANNCVVAGVQRIHHKVNPEHRNERQEDGYSDTHVPEFTCPSARRLLHRAPEIARKNAAANRVRDQPRRMRTLQLNWSLSVPKAQCDK
jgi:hypothetical protein